MPDAAGRKSTEIVQLAPPASALPQPGESTTKSPWVTPMREIPTGTLFGFFTVTLSGALTVPSVCFANESDLGLKLRAPRTAVPFRGTISGLLVAPFATFNYPERLPAAVGVKVSATTHLPFAARLLAQLVSLLSIAKSPLVANPVSVRAALLLFESVTFLNALVAPTVPNTCAANATCFGEAVNVAAAAAASLSAAKPSGPAAAIAIDAKAPINSTPIARPSRSVATGGISLSGKRRGWAPPGASADAASIWNIETASGAMNGR